jgi:hypothetical protein
MSSKVARSVFVSFFLILVFHINCKGPYQEEVRPVIWLDPFELSFSASEVGPNPGPQTLKVKNAGLKSPLDYNISANMSWVSISPTSGSSSGQIIEHVVSIDKTGLTAREEAYAAKIVVSSPAAYNSPQQVDVLLKLSKEPPAEISVTPRGLTFVGSVGGGNPSPQIINVRNSGQGTLNYSITDDVSWMNVTPASGSSTGGQNAHSVSVNVSGLGTGTYSGNITISDTNALNNPQVMSVTLQIGTSLPPTISVTPQTLRFSATLGGANPSAEKIRIGNGGGGTLSYVLSDDAAWMNVSPTSGTSTGQTNTHSVSINISGLGKGTHTGIITISSPNAANSPQFVNVTLEISEAQPPPTDNKIAVSCRPSSGGTGSVIDVTISILGNLNKIKAFGLEVTYDATMFDFVSVNKGSLTGSWGTVAGTVVSAGKVRIGGYVGDPSFAIPVGSSGSIVVLKLKVTCSACSDGKQSQICMGSFTDDIVGMTPAPACAVFTYRK